MPYCLLNKAIFVDFSICGLYCFCSANSSYLFSEDHQIDPVLPWPLEIYLRFAHPAPFALAWVLNDSLRAGEYGNLWVQMNYSL
jgi:hypothetical protein